MGSEEWMPVKGYEGMYEVSNIGRIRSLDRSVVSKIGVKKRVKGLVLKQANVRGYLGVSLAKDGVRKMTKVHRIVAEAFIPNPENKPQVNHKDGNKENNRVENLEWATALENQMHAIRTGLKTGEGRFVSVTRSDGAVFSSLKSAAEATGCTIQDVCNVCRGWHKTTRGFSFRYTEVES